MIIYSENISPRLQYTAKFIFQEVCGINYTLCNDINTLNLKEPIINYSGREIEGSFRIRPAGLMKTEPVLNDFYPTVSLNKEFPLLFPIENSDLNFDIFSAVFFMISRYEEYQDAPGDKYKRYQAKNSIAVKEGFIDKPIVNIWISIFVEELKESLGLPEFNQFETDYLFTIDVDNPWAHKNKGPVRWLGGLLKFLITGNVQLFMERLKITFGKSKDPYDSYDFIISNHDKLLIFLLIGSKGKFDNRFSHLHKKWKTLIQELSEKARIAIHPSWYSNYNDGELNWEIEALRDISKIEIQSSRQHFLILDFPETYQNLVEAGIENDYSMGYSEITGFRAGTASPFAFYNIEKEEETDLTIHPFLVMDRTLKDYMKLSPKEAEKLVLDLILKVRKWGGCFIPVWHNESLGSTHEWKGWNSVYLAMLNDVNKNLKN